MSALMRVCTSALLLGFSLSAWAAGKTSTRLGTDTEAPPQRLALLIGNSKYEHLNPLKNPKSDVDRLAAKLKQLGFQTVVKYDLNHDDFVEALSKFQLSIAPGDIALFYYSGHGVQLEGMNYLIPISLQAATSPVALKGSGISLALVRDSLSPAKLSLIVLDACRTLVNFSAKGPAEGLAPFISKGSLVAYAADDGQSASDNDTEELSLFTKHLISELDKHDETLCQLFGGVREAVDKASEHVQFPFVYDGVIGDFVFNRTTTEESRKLSTVLNAVGQAKLWAAIQGSDNPNDFAAFLAPGLSDRKYAKAAGDHLSSLMSSTATAVGLVPVNAQDISPEVVALSNQGERLFYENAYMEALKTFEKLLALRSSDWSIMYDYATCLLRLGRYGEAVLMYSKVIELNPEFPWAFYNRGVAHYLIGNLNESIGDYTTALGYRPSYALGYNNLALAKRDAGDLAGAQQDVRKAIALDSSYAPAYFNSARILKEFGMAAEATAYETAGKLLTIHEVNAASQNVVVSAQAEQSADLEDASDRPYRPVTAEMYNHPPASEWLQYRRTNDGQGFSPLKEITAANVKNLEPVWSFSTGLNKGHEAVPLEHDGILFVVAPYNVVFALDARSGKFIWKYERDIPDKALSVVCCDVVNKGGVLYGDKFIYGTIDAHLVALNAKTGAVDWDTKVTDYPEGTTITNAPVVLHDKVVIGMTGGEFGARGFLAAYNAGDGKFAWKTFSIPGPGEPGNDTWGASKDVADKDTWKHSGGTTWTNGYYDAQNDIFWQPTGNPGPWAAYVRPGANAGSSLLIAFDGKDGHIRGLYQPMPHDMWDYGTISQPFAVDFMKDGKEVHATFQTHKDGFTYVIDRDPKHFGRYGGSNGENVPAIYVKPFMDGITGTKGNLDAKLHPLYDPAKDSTTPNLVDVCPSFLGGPNYLVPSYDAATKTAYISGNYWCETIKGTQIEPWAPYKAYVYAESHMHVMPGHEGGGGFIKAIDVTKGKTKWEHDMTDANWSGLVATAGGVLFGGGTDTRESFALDTATGKELWSFKTNSGQVGAPITYEIDGVQYVAVVAGFGGAIPIWTGEIKDKFNKNAPQGGAVWVFALRKK